MPVIRARVTGYIPPRNRKKMMKVEVRTKAKVKVERKEYVQFLSTFALVLFLCLPYFLPVLYFSCIFDRLPPLTTGL